jgi:hypothetical protein
VPLRQKQGKIPPSGAEFAPIRLLGRRYGALLGKRGPGKCQEHERTMYTRAGIYVDGVTRVSNRSSNFAIMKSFAGTLAPLSKSAPRQAGIRRPLSEIRGMT